ncbi:hypothetical protein J5X92_15770 [Alteromonas sp. K632G]|jgi:hypothetical protein|uniref:hypothetical protein n=1 Tax=Alteromonas sp. K632G TaxID=2820757 RepID=UPI001AD7189A|nr:hypothetical protein [Alteromonas sp. K632G]MBO7923665.1 hypothetical protein [Alteromonas sp. K632G]
MSESKLVSQLNTLIDNTVFKVTGVSKHLSLFVYVSVALLLVSLFFASTLYLAIPFLLVSCIPIFIILRLAQKLLHVKKLDSGRGELIRLISNQESIKEKFQKSFDDIKSSMGKGKTKIKTTELIERAKLFLDMKKIMNVKNIKTDATSDILTAINSLALLGDPLYLLLIGFCYLWLLLICIGSIFTIIF